MSSSESDTEQPTKTPDQPEEDGDTASSNENDQGSEEVGSTFEDLGLVDVLCKSCERMGWKKPSRIQAEAIPVALEGRDVIGLAETGSGKTGAFALPVLQALLENPQRLFGLVLTPTRELAFQISEQFESLGKEIGVKCCVLVGGLQEVSQAVMLGKKPHIIIATPGRLVWHLENTKGFNLRALKYLVLDEADRILNMDFEIEVDKILSNLPKEGRRNMMFSATMTKKVAKLQRASLKNPAKVEVSSKYQTVDKLKQYYLFQPESHKELYLVHLINEMAGNSFIIFCSTCNGTLKLALMLRHLGFSAIPLNGQMSQDKRLGALNKFKARSRSILLATDVASRGLDIPHVDIVLNYDIPTHSKDYIHRVGRTARVGRAGKAITFVSQYDVELYQRIEQLIGKKLPKYDTQETLDKKFVADVQEAICEAKREIKELEEKKKDKKKRKRMGDMFEDSQNYVGIRDRMGGKKSKRGKRMK